MEGVVRDGNTKHRFTCSLEYDGGRTITPRSSAPDITPQRGASAATRLADRAITALGSTTSPSPSWPPARTAADSRENTSAVVNGLAFSPLPFGPNENTIISL
jgi:hypothetical protein